MDIEEKDNCHLSAEASMQQESTAGTAIDWNWTSASAADAYTPPVTTQGVANAVGLVVHGALKQVHEHTDKTIAETLAGIGAAGAAYLVEAAGVSSSFLAADAALLYATGKEAQSTYKAGVELYRTGHVTTPDYFDSLAEKAKNSIVQNASAFDIVSRNNNQGNELPAAKAQLESFGAQSIQVGAGLIGGGSGDLSIQLGRSALKSTFDTAMWLGKTTLTDSFGPQSEYALATGVIPKTVTTNLAKGSPSLLAPSVASADMPIMLSQNQGGDGSQLSGEPLTDTQIRELLKDETRLSQLLTPRQLEVLKLRYEPLSISRQRTLEEIAQQLNTTKAPIYYTLKNALAELGLSKDTEPGQIRELLANEAPRLKMLLTPRQIEVLNLYYEPASFSTQRTLEEIARQLGISTARVHAALRSALHNLRFSEGAEAGHILELLQDETRTAGLSSLELQVLKLRYAERTDGKPIILQEIADRLQLSQSYVKSVLDQALDKLEDTRVLRIRELLQDGERTASLSPLELRVLQLRYEQLPGGARTKKEVAQQLELSHTYVGQILKRALNKLLQS